jgi:hypothetical protein
MTPHLLHHLLTIPIDAAPVLNSLELMLPRGAWTYGLLFQKFPGFVH